MTTIKQSQSCLGKQNQGLYYRVKKNLICLGFDFSNLGAQYLQDIIVEVLSSPKLLHALNSEVYSIIAKKHNTTCKSVERVTRLAIIKAHKHGLIKEIAYFCQEKPPTIKQLVNFMYDFFVEFDYML